jgi:hypothetical protein
MAMFMEAVPDEPLFGAVLAAAGDPKVDAGSATKG